MIEFKAWPKTPRLNRVMIVTEKIDGTNAAVIVESIAAGYGHTRPAEGALVDSALTETGAPYWTTVGDNLPGIVTGEFVVAAQSRKRLISPGKQSDNAGFARWVRDNAERLAELLGEGYHYGEWWGKGVQTGYGQDGKRFSLFNVKRYAGVADPEIGLDTVPILYEGPFDTAMVKEIVGNLRYFGSRAAPGQKAEGVVVFHEASGSVFKATCEKDEQWKGA
jgi:RNA ligase